MSIQPIQTSTVTPCLIEQRIPYEIMEIVLSYLCQEELHKLSGVSNYFRKTAVAVINRQVFQKTIKFIRICMACLDRAHYSELSEELGKLISGTPIFDNVNLLELKSTVLELKEILIGLILALSKKKGWEMNQLQLIFHTIYRQYLFEKEELPTYFKGVIDQGTLSLYKELQRVNSYPEGETKDRKIGNYVYKFKRRGSFDKAINLASQIKSLSLRKDELEHLADLLTVLGMKHKATDVRLLAST